MEFMNTGFMTFNWTALANTVSNVPVNTTGATNLSVGVNAVVLVEAGVKDANGMQVLKMPVPAAQEFSVPWKEVEGGSAPSANEK